MTPIIALHLILTPSDGSPVASMFAGAMTTPELCQMAGESIAARVEAEVPGIAVTFTCEPMGEQA